MMRRRGFQMIAAAALALAVGAPLVAGMYETLTVKKGDTLWDLSQEHLGDALRFPEWVEINDLRSGDPHWIYPGEVLNIPGTVMEPMPEPEPEVEVPTPMIEEMLNKLSERLSKAQKQLADLKEEMEHLDSHLHDEDFSKLLKKLDSIHPMDLSSVEKRINQLSKTISSKVDKLSNRTQEQHKMTKSELDALKKELATLMSSVEKHEMTRQKAVEELAAKMMELHAPVNPIGEVHQNKRTVGVLSFLAASVALMVVTAAR
ncbi:MAG: LysM peptidoglycan-binding domain-containing protein [Candidatus Poribacteria bacterium]|nr:LysM peptidoglycan-binding domain-containing protein [Candidatus Poribacteria bacterium]